MTIVGRAGRPTIRRSILSAVPLAVLVAVVLPAALPGPAAPARAESSQALATVSSTTVSAARRNAQVHLAAARVPTLRWRPCGGSLVCAGAAVPRDWTRPRGATIGLLLVKRPATGPGGRLGTIFVNPGGPGGSGADMVAGDPGVLPASVRARFDVIGVDPRFVGASRPPATCLDDEPFADLFAALPSFPVTRAEENGYVAAMAGYADRCARHTYLRYASTASVAHDLELLRRAVGERRLNFVGYSYGSYLGQMYAQLFPGRVRAMVLDGVVDAEQWATGRPGQWRTTPFSSRLGSDRASSQALAEFFRLCRSAGPVRCPLAAGGDPAATFRAIADGLLAAPVTLAGGDRLDYPTLIGATASVLYTPGSWQPFAAELQALYVELSAPAGSPAGPAAPGEVSAQERSPRRRAGATSALVAAARSVRARGEAAAGPSGMPSFRAPSGVAPADNPFAAFAAVGCADSRNPDAAAHWVAAASARERSYPYFGRAWAWTSLACATWTLRDPTAYYGPFGAEASSSMLVIGTTLDPATPYRGAVVTARRFPGARLLTVRGYGHTSAVVPLDCVHRAVAGYLLTTTLPPRGASCRQRPVPFR